MGGWSPLPKTPGVHYNFDMGIRVHPIWPPDPGPDCLSCSPDPWPAGSTPSVVRVVFRGLANYLDWPEPPNGLPIHISNDSINPCYFTAELFYGISTYEVEYDAAMAVVILTRTDPNPYTIFDGVLDPCSIGPFSNLTWYPNGDPIGGSAVLLDFPLSIIVALTTHLHIQPDGLGLYDIKDSAIPDVKCVRLTGQLSPGSVLIHYNTAYPGGFLMPGIIALWSGSIVTIPTGWQLCDGTNGTPDLRDRFIIGAGPIKAPGTTGGAEAHTHIVDIPEHQHGIPSGEGIYAGSDFDDATSPQALYVVSNSTAHLPPYYALCYIMYL